MNRLLLIRLNSIDKNPSTLVGSNSSNILKKVLTLPIVAAATAYTSAVNVEAGEDRQAGYPPNSIVLPVFYGDKRNFPNFWNAFAPSVYENPR